LLESIHVKESGNVVAALELRNTSNRPIDLSQSKEQSVAPALIWSVGSKIYFAQARTTVPRRIGARQTLVIGPARLWIAPAVEARGTVQAVAASLDTKAMHVSAQPVNVSITPAQWGPTTGRLRACLGAESEVVPAGQPVHLFLCVYNSGSSAWKFAAPDWEAPNVRSEDGLITLRYQPRPNGRMITQPAGLIQRHDLDVSSIFARPGTYRVRVQLFGLSTAPSSGASSAPSQILDSNEITLRVIAGE